MGLLVTIASLVLTLLNAQRQRLDQQIYQQEVLNVAIIAVQSQHSYLDLDGIAVQVVQNDRELTVYHEGEEVIRLEKN